MRRFCLLLLMLFTVSKLFSQSFYVVTSTLQVKKITITPNGVIAADIATGNQFYGVSIAVYKHTFYYAYGNCLYSAQLSGNSLINAKLLSSGFPMANSLTVDTDGNLYACKTNLYKFDTHTLTLHNLGTCPFISSGDLAFYNKQLYLASTAGIVKINTTDPSKSTVFISSTTPVFGLAATAYSSTKNKFYATVVDSHTNNNTFLMELDMEKGIIKDTAAYLPYNVYDCGSDVESGSIPQISVDSIINKFSCPVNANGTLQVFCQNPLADYTYTLNNTINNTTGVFTAITPGTYDIRVSSAMQVVDTVIKIAPQANEVPAMIPNVIDENCDQKGQLSFSVGDGGNGYQIYSAFGTYPVSHIYTGLSAGNYKFYLLSTGGCVADSINVGIKRNKCSIDISSINISKDCEDLHNGSATVNCKPRNSVTTLYYISSTSTYNKGIVNQTGAFASLMPGWYNVFIVTSDSISKDTSFIIPDYYLQRPKVIRTVNDQQFSNRGDITLTARGPANYYIKYRNDTYPSGHTFSNLDGGDYNFSIVDEKGCLLDTAIVKVKMIGTLAVTFPNTFTPNNDGINDVFIGKGDASQFRMSIYNRYGALVFTSGDINKGWDGSYNGQPLATGTYYWMATYTDDGNQRRTQSGSVTIIR